MTDLVSPIDTPRPRAWPAYLVTLAMLPISAWLTGLLFAVPAIAMGFYEIATGPGRVGDLGPLARQWLDRLSEPLPSMVIGVFASATSLAFGAWIMASRRPQAIGERPAIRLRLQRAAPLDLALASIGLIGLTAALEAAIALAGLGDYGRLAEMRDTILALAMHERLLLSLIVAFGAGFAEELYFRGFLQTRLELAHGRVPGLLITAALFGAFHMDALHSPVAALMGIALGLIVIWTGSIRPAIAAHVANNFVSVLGAGLDLSPIPALAAGAVVCVSALAVLAKRHRGENHAPVW